MRGRGRGGGAAAAESSLAGSGQTAALLLHWQPTHARAPGAGPNKHRRWLLLLLLARGCLFVQPACQGARTAASDV